MFMLFLQHGSGLGLIVGSEQEFSPCAVDLNLTSAMFESILHDALPSRLSVYSIHDHLSNNQDL